MATCKHCGATLSPIEPLAYADIIGNEHAKRAAEVALAGRHSITFIGGEEAQALAEWCATYGTTAFATQLCPCGGYGHLHKPCDCSVKEITRYRAAKSRRTALAADIVITSTMPSTDQIMRHQHGQRGESEERVLERIDHARKNRMVVLDHLDDPCSSLLRAFIAQLHPPASRIKRMRQVAVTIAMLDGDDHIQTHHLAEALQYYPRANW